MLTQRARRADRALFAVVLAALVVVWLGGNAGCIAPGCTPPVGGDEAALPGPEDIGDEEGPADDQEGGGEEDTDSGGEEEPVNRAPVVEVGDPFTTREGFVATLTGAAVDPENQPVTLEWTQEGGAPVVLDDPASATPSFTAPQVSTLAEAVLVFRLTARDSEGAEASAVQTVRVLLLGDVSGDDRVDQTDLDLIRSLFGTQGDEAEPFDLNGDGRIDGRDVLIVRREMGRGLE